MKTIDAVVCWVDSTDLAWQGVFEQYKPSAVDSAATHTARFYNADELKYCLRSIRQYLPWIRKVWVVTMNQKPRWWIDCDFATIVDHKDIMPASALPTFNSLAIETCMHRIPGLAQQFIYLNDDFFFGKEINEGWFFRDEIMQLHWHGSHTLPPQPRNIYEDALHNTGLVLAKHYGLQAVARVFNRPLHHAIPKTIQACKRAWDLFPAEMAETCHGKFRERTHVLHYISNYIALLDGGAIVAPMHQMISYKFYTNDSAWLLHKSEPLPHLLCINDICQHALLFQEWAGRMYPQQSFAEIGAIGQIKCNAENKPLFKAPTVFLKRKKYTTK